jgi:hypothetical protein
MSVRGALNSLAQVAVSSSRMPLNTAQLRVGRLLEVRAADGFRSVASVDRMFENVERELSSLPAGQRHVTIADWRECQVMSPEAARRLSTRMASTNLRTERSAALAAQGSPTTVLQFLRVIRESGHPDRKLFFSEVELIDWLAEVLTPAETLRLRVFLGVPEVALPRLSSSR